MRRSPGGDIGERARDTRERKRGGVEHGIRHGGPRDLPILDLEAELTNAEVERPAVGPGDTRFAVAVREPVGRCIGVDDLCVRQRLAARRFHDSHEQDGAPRRDRPWGEYNGAS